MIELNNDNLMLTVAIATLIGSTGVLVHQLGQTCARVLQRWEDKRDYLREDSSRVVEVAISSEHSLPNKSLSSTTFPYITKKYYMIANKTSLPVKTQLNMMLLFKVRAAQKLARTMTVAQQKDAGL